MPPTAVLGDMPPLPLAGGITSILGREELKRFALKSLEFLLAHLRADDGGLYHGFAEGKAHVTGLPDDYVWVTAALLHAFQISGQSRYLATAQELMETALRTLWDDADGGFFGLCPDPTTLGTLKRPSIEDTSIPSPNAMAAIVLDQLAALTNEPWYQQWLSGSWRPLPAGLPSSGGSSLPTP
jgi:uncharacterized protein YyaL (SSP411 family)